MRLLGYSTQQSYYSPSYKQARERKKKSRHHDRIYGSKKRGVKEIIKIRDDTLCTTSSLACSLVVVISLEFFYTFNFVIHDLFVWWKPLFNLVVVKIFHFFLSPLAFIFWCCHDAYDGSEYMFITHTYGRNINMLLLLLYKIPIYFKKAL